MLQDDVEDCYRFSDDMLVSILNRALNDLNRIRPDAWYVYYGQYANGVPEITNNFVTDVGQVSWEAAFQPDTRFYHAVVQYVVGMTKSVEDTYVQADEGSWNGGEVHSHMRLFKQLVLNT